jgi:hypothetical protein
VTLSLIVRFVQYGSRRLRLGEPGSRKLRLALALCLASAGLTQDVDARAHHHPDSSARLASAVAPSGFATSREAAPGVEREAAPGVERAAAHGEANLTPVPIDARVYRALRMAQDKMQADPALLLAIAWQESRFDPKARNHQSSARGLLQFTTVTWLTVVRDFGARHGLAHYAAAISTGRNGELTVTPPRLRRKILALRDDPNLEVIMAAERLAQEKGTLETDIGRPAVTADLYVLHLLGPTGAKEFLTALARRPNKPSVDVVGTVARPNRGLFVQHGRYLTVAETYQNIKDALTQQVEQHASLFAAAG